MVISTKMPIQGRKWGDGWGWDGAGRAELPQEGETVP